MVPTLGAPEGDIDGPGPSPVDAPVDLAGPIVQRATALDDPAEATSAAVGSEATAHASLDNLIPQTPATGEFSTLDQPIATTLGVAAEPSSSAERSAPEAGHSGPPVAMPVVQTESASLVSGAQATAEARAVSAPPVGDHFEPSGEPEREATPAPTLGTTDFPIAVPTTATYEAPAPPDPSTVGPARPLVVSLLGANESAPLIASSTASMFSPAPSPSVPVTPTVTGPGAGGPSSDPPVVVQRASTAIASGATPTSLPVAARPSTSGQSSSLSTYAGPDAGDVAVASGLGRRTSDGEVVFRLPADSATVSGAAAEGTGGSDGAWAGDDGGGADDGTYVQLSADDGASVQRAPAAGAPSGGGAGAAGGGDLDELARRLYGRIRLHLRHELRLDRERAGSLVEPRR
jgi:hypothetical protein